MTAKPVTSQVRYRKMQQVAEVKSSNAPRKNRNVAPSPLACKTCRDRHLKCDGVQPICSRCQNSDQVCYYVQSRRGWRGPGKKVEPGQDVVQTVSAEITPNTLQGASPNSLGSSHRSDSLPSTESSRDFSHGSSVERWSWNTQPLAQDELTHKGARVFGIDQSLVNLSRQTANGDSQGHSHVTGAARLQELYYLQFHDAHPIMIPFSFLQPYNNLQIPSSVLSMIEYLGAVVSKDYRLQHVRQLAESHLESIYSVRNGFSVQALLLWAIAEEAHDHTESAYQTVQSAIDIALAIGMNSRDFASKNGRGSPVLEESWRRTYWELYVVEALIAAVQQRSLFRLHSVITDVDLPCEEAQYHSGNVSPLAKSRRILAHPRFQIPIPRRLGDLDEDAFADDDETLSSFAYRIQAARELGGLLKLDESYSAENMRLATSLDSSLTNWVLHLPSSKQQALNSSGNVDEMLFQAHGMINA